MSKNIPSLAEEPPIILRECGAKEIRTPDLLNANQALYQLSYSPA